MSFDELRRGAVASYAISRWINFTTLVAMEEKDMDGTLDKLEDQYIK